MNEERAEIVKSGHWTYDGSLQYEVWIVRQNFEFYYEEGFDSVERLNGDGEAFAVLCAQDGRPIGGVSEFLSMEEAIGAAERVIPQGIQWDNHRLQPLFGGRHYRLEPETQRDT
jgi:hypothetical protein